MEHDTAEHLHDKKEDIIMSRIADSANLKVDATKDTPQQNLDASEKIVETNKVSTNSGENVTQAAGFGEIDTSADVNMEASITSDDVLRAGGFGARDDISSFLPVAVDSTDFEASLRDARDYEEPQGQINRPGLGWTEAMKSEER